MTSAVKKDNLFDTSINPLNVLYAMLVLIFHCVHSNKFCHPQRDMLLLLSNDDLITRFILGSVTFIALGQENTGSLISIDFCAELEQKLLIINVENSVNTYLFHE